MPKATNIKKRQQVKPELPAPTPKPVTTSYLAPTNKNKVVFY